MASRLARQELLVELNNGTVHEISVGNPSLVAFDRTRAARKWPTTKESPIFWATFIAWHHMKARGLVSCNFEKFESEVCEVIEFVNPKKKGKKGKTVDPTPPTAVRDSSSDSQSLSALSVPQETHGLTSPMTS